MGITVGKIAITENVLGLSTDSDTYKSTQLERKLNELELMF